MSSRRIFLAAAAAAVTAAAAGGALIARRESGQGHERHQPATEARLPPEPNPGGVSSEARTGSTAAAARPLPPLGDVVGSIERAEPQPINVYERTPEQEEKWQAYQDRVRSLVPPDRWLPFLQIHEDDCANKARLTLVLYDELAMRAREEKWTSLSQFWDAYEQAIDDFDEAETDRSREKRRRLWALLGDDVARRVVADTEAIKLANRSCPRPGYSPALQGELDRIESLEDARRDAGGL